jgi:transposase
MSEKRRNYTDEFKREAIRLVTEHGYGVSATARNVGINSTMRGRWQREVKTNQRAALPGNGRLPLDKEA